MSTSQPFYFKDNRGKFAAPGAPRGNDANSGRTSAAAKQNYNTALTLAQTAPAGTIFKFLKGYGSISNTGRRLTNPNTVTEMTNVTFDGTSMYYETDRQHNMTVGQLFNVRGTNQKTAHGKVICTEVGVVPLSAPLRYYAKYVPASLSDKVAFSATPPTNPIRVGYWHNKIRFDGAMISFESYTEAGNTATSRPGVQFTGTGNISMHEFSHATNRAMGWKWDDMDFEGGGLSTTPRCFFIYRGNKESFYLNNCSVKKFSQGMYCNHKKNRTSAAPNDVTPIYDIRVTNCDISDNLALGGLSGQPEYSLVSFSRLVNNGHRGAIGGSSRDHNIYFSSMTGTRVLDNEMSMAGMKNGRAYGTEMVVHGVCYNMLIEGNWIHNDPGVTTAGNYALDVTTGYRTPERFENINIRYNRIEECGKRSIVCNALLNSTIELNTIVNNAPYTHQAIWFNQNNTDSGDAYFPPTPTTNNIDVRGNYITGSSISVDIKPDVGTNIRISRTNVPVPPRATSDTIVPIVTAPADITAISTGVNTSVNIGAATATDNVDGTLVPTSNAPASYPLGTTTVTWTATDSSGNIGTDTQIITVNARVDGIPPVVTAPADITAVSVGLFTSVTLGKATAIDNVDGALTPTTTSTARFSVGISYVVWTAVDAAGNVGQATQTVTITPMVDSIAPVVTAPTDITVTQTGVLTDVNIGTANTVDNKDGVLTAAPSDIGPFPVGLTYVIWTAADAAGNVGSDSQLITVNPATVNAIEVITTTEIKVDGVTVSKSITSTTN